jgi:KDO2-lipid IV(A) lauroyltransferase
MAEGTRFERFQGLLLAGFIELCRRLPLRLVSGIGGGLARTIGPRLGLSRRAHANMQAALPELSPADRRDVVSRVWDNLGRVIVEYPHLTRLRCFGPDPDVEVIGTEHVDAAIARGKSIILFSGHLGNWEVGAIAAVQYGLDIIQVYRAANNPAVERVVHALRRSLGVEPVTKGAAGARKLVAAVKRGRHIIMLVDQKMNDGIAVPFFGRDAMTAPAVAEFALRYGCTLLPVRMRRLGSQPRFRIEVEPPMEVASTGDQAGDVSALMGGINRILERWIRDDPGQWFWLHRRWPRG